MELMVVALVASVFLVYKGCKAAPKVRNKVLSARSLKKDCEQEDSEQGLTTSQLAMKALRQGNMKQAVALVSQLPRTLAGRVPATIAFHILATAAKATNFDDAMSELVALKGKMPSGPLEAAIAKSLKSRNAAECHRLHAVSNMLSIPKSQQAFQTLASAYSTDATALRKLVQEAGAPLQRPFAEMVLDACATMKDDSLAAVVLEKVSYVDAAALRKNKCASPAMCAKDGIHRSISATTTEAGGSDKSNSDCSSPRINTVDETDALMGFAAASQPPPHSTAEADKEKGGSTYRGIIATRANDIRSCGRNGDLAGVLKVYDRLDSQTADSTLVMNSLVDACLACNALGKAAGIFERAKILKLADTVTYNTMIKGYLASGQEDAARQVLEELKKTGLTATRPSYHGLLNARVKAGDLRGAWRLVADMQLSDISPNAVTCSILLKAKSQSVAEVSKVLALIDAMQEPMDEVLFSSVVEVCIRTKRLDMLSKQMEKFTRLGKSGSLTAPTYGTMIKAFGLAHDTEQVWHLWRDMIGHNVLPTSVTLGCMVEALVTNGYSADAMQLVRKMCRDERTRPLVNAVIYTSLIKGFASASETEKMMAVYAEMREHKVQPSRITYNTILNTFAEHGQMHRVPAVVEDMKSAVPPVHPDTVTYTTMVKGFCNSGNLDRAFDVLKDMKTFGKCMPDEILYNSLINGCSKELCLDGAMNILSDMKKSGIAPSNYTLSMLVKLMGRCRRIEEAFPLLADLSRDYGLKANIQVYTCLIQGCFNNGRTDEAIYVHEKIIKEGLLPDAMTYSVLVKGCLRAGIVDKAAYLTRCAYGCASTPPCSRGTPPGLSDGCLDEVISALGRDSTQALTLLSELESSAAQTALPAHYRASKKAIGKDPSTVRKVAP